MKLSIFQTLLAVELSNALVSYKSPVRRSLVMIENGRINRASFLQKTMASLIGASLVSLIRPGVAGASDIGDFGRLSKGLDGLEYLLSNWVKETTLCNPECNRNPDTVRGYLGRRSTTHPLYKIEQLMNGKPLLERIDPDRYEDFVGAIESWNTAISQADQMAYTSMFGEYNPGGGKDEVEKYLELSRKEVLNARDALKTIIEVADLK